MSRTECDVAVVGAGPQGLAVAAHLGQAGVETRVFGDPMGFWREHMPTGMFLRSSPRASNISDPRHAFSLSRFQAANNVALGAPVPLDRFIDYGLWFQREAAVDLDTRHVACVSPAPNGFRIALRDGEVVAARRVVVAAGISGFAWRPPVFGSLSPSVVTHTVDHRDSSRFRGMRVIVVGGGQSGMESAALLSDAGADVELIVRAPRVRWLNELTELKGQIDRALWAIAYPPTEVGPPGLNWLVWAPGVFRLLPRDMQTTVAYRCIRPAAAAWVRPRSDRAQLTAGREIVAVDQDAGRLDLTLDDGSRRSADHVMLATGYRIDVARYQFLSSELLRRLSVSDGYPDLGPGLESSVGGLHFVGAAAARSFGPIMRFVAGGSYAARAVTKAVLRRRPSISGAPYRNYEGA
jgi:cation diffusion facilitator CzcD-associated flavoprotein CzcO